MSESTSTISKDDVYPLVQQFSHWSGFSQYSWNFIQQHQALIVEKTGEEVTVAIPLGSDWDSLYPVLQRYHRGLRVHCVRAKEEEFQSVLPRLHPSPQWKKHGETEDWSSSREHAPTVELVQSIIEDGLKAGASDIHIEESSQEMCVRYRIDGHLLTAFTLSSDHCSSVSTRIKLMAHLDIMERRLPQDGRLTVSSPHGNCHMRVSIVPVLHGESIVLRIFQRDGGLPSCTELGFSQEVVNSLRQVFHHGHGLFLATGPTGSGKTTSLYAFLADCQNHHRKVVALEDPVEYVLNHVNQIPVHEEIGLGFETLLRRVLRQDPDVILVGEIRDEQTAQLAVRASLTGHLVLATLHTTDGPSAVIRLLDMGIPLYALSSVLRGVLAQRLVRRLCSHCSQKKPVDVHQMTGKSHEILSLGVAVGCSHCHFRGYWGREAVGTWLALDRKKIHQIAQYGEEGLKMHDLQNALMKQVLQKAQDQVTSFAEVMKLAAG